jgi:nucleoid-associated protein
MTQNLVNAVIHKLEKESGGLSRLVEAQACLNVSDEPLQALVNQVHDVYSGRESKSYGRFDPDLTPVSAEPHLLSLRDGMSPDFLDMSKQLLRNQIILFINPHSG